MLNWIYKSNKTNKTNMTHKSNLIPPHGGYRKLISYQSAEIVFDLTKIFCEKFLDPSHKSNGTYRSYRQVDQMIQAARSGKQNIAEGSMASGTSKKTELKLVGVARASFEELLLDFEDFLRNNSMEKWGKDHPIAREVRALAYKSDRSNRTYLTYYGSAESASNVLICIIHQTNFLLDRQLKALEKSFTEEGGFTERLYRERTRIRNKSDWSNKTYRNY